MHINMDVCRQQNSRLNAPFSIQNAGTVGILFHAFRILSLQVTSYIYLRRLFYYLLPISIYFICWLKLVN